VLSDRLECYTWYAVVSMRFIVLEVGYGALHFFVCVFFCCPFCYLWAFSSSFVVLCVRTVCMSGSIFTCFCCVFCSVAVSCVGDVFISCVISPQASSEMWLIVGFSCPGGSARLVTTHFPRRFVIFVSFFPSAPSSFFKGVCLCVCFHLSFWPPRDGFAPFRPATLVSSWVPRSSLRFSFIAHIAYFPCSCSLFLSAFALLLRVFPRYIFGAPVYGGGLVFVSVFAQMSVSHCLYIVSICPCLF